MRENFYKYLAKTNSNPLGIEIKSAKGNYLYNNKNKKYLDFIAGVSVCNLGHGHPKVINAIEIIVIIINNMFVFKLFHYLFTM